MKYLSALSFHRIDIASKNYSGLQRCKSEYQYLQDPPINKFSPTHKRIYTTHTNTHTHSLTHTSSNTCVICFYLIDRWVTIRLFALYPGNARRHDEIVQACGGNCRSKSNGSNHVPVSHLYVLLPISVRPNKEIDRDDIRAKCYSCITGRLKWLGTDSIYSYL